jgi:putative restriction endonuclease
MIGGTDGELRRAVFEWLTRHREEFGTETFTRDELSNWQYQGRRVPLVGPQGIWKPAVCEIPISIATIAGGPYDDAFDERSGRLSYAYRGIDPEHRDNRGLRRAMRDRVPLVYFVAIEPGRYVAQYPVFIVGDNPAALTFDVQVDDIWASLRPLDDEHAIGEGEDARRSYVTRAVRQRLHQVAFRERVIRAYRERCALCLLRHQELLDAAHITPDSSDEGDPVVSNGIALCKLHHAAFDRMFFAIRPDYVVEVRPSILAESDGPMLVVGLQQIHAKPIYLPRHPADRPDPARLEKRYEEFRQAS